MSTNIESGFDDPTQPTPRRRWRPLELGEIIQEGDELWYFSKWVPTNWGGCTHIHKRSKYRTRRPRPAPTPESDDDEPCPHGIPWVNHCKVCDMPPQDSAPAAPPEYPPHHAGILCLKCKTMHAPHEAHYCKWQGTACGWTHNEDGSYWDTECNEAFWFENDGPVENSYRFCPGCGRKVEIKHDTPEPGEGAGGGDPLQTELDQARQRIAELEKGITEIKAGTRIGWFMTDLGAKCSKLLNQ